MLIRGRPWNLAAERCRIERITRCILRTPVMKRIIRSSGLGMERIAAQVYIFFHFEAEDFVSRVLPFLFLERNTQKTLFWLGLEEVLVSLLAACVAQGCSEDPSLLL